jgi:hypothetical protein
MKQGSLGIALLFLSGAVHAVNPVQGWYAGINIGASYVPTVNFKGTSPVTLQTVNGKLTYDVLGQIGGQAGYRCDHYRVEGQFFYNNNPYNSLEIGNYAILSPSTSTAFRLEGSTDTGAVLVNGFYDFLPTDTTSSTVPYVGLGVGYAYVADNIKFYYNETQLDAATTRKHVSSLAGQAIIGASFFMDDFTVFGLDLRYFTATAKTELLQTRPQIISVNVTFNGAFNLA